MSDAASTAPGLVANRLAVLSSLLDKAEDAAEGSGIEELAASRLAPDMHPLFWQVAAVAQQALGFAAWCRGESLGNSVPEVSGWTEARGRLADARESVAALPGALALPEVKRIEIEMMGMYLELTGQRYVDEWLLPNLYFHADMAYALLRAHGIAIGKADLLASLLTELRPMA